MSTIKKIITPVLAVVALVISLISATGFHFGSTEVVGGALNNQYIEQYDPAVRYNGGINTQLPIKTSNTLTAATISMTTSNTATSTTALGCIQTTATSTASPIVLVYGTSFTGTTTLPSGVAASGGLVAWKFGSCPL